MSNEYETNYCARLVAGLLGIITIPFLLGGLGLSVMMLPVSVCQLAANSKEETTTKHFLKETRDAFKDTTVPLLKYAFFGKLGSFNASRIHHQHTKNPHYQRIGSNI